MSTQHFYVAELTLRDGAGYTSLHRSRIGAEAEVVHRAQLVGIPATVLADLDAAPTVESYGISYLPLLP